MSNEEKAKIARENGANSHDPTSNAGKAKVRCQKWAKVTAIGFRHFSHREFNLRGSTAL